MADASTSRTMSPELQKVAERAQREPDGRFHSLAHLIDERALERAFCRIRPDAAVGVDGVTKRDYEQNLERNLRDLHTRLKARRYRHRPIRRVHIPKGQGKTRPIGISCIEDKIVQDAIRELLESVYEQDFLDCSYGFRPRRSAHDALRALNREMYQGTVSWILEADIVSFFDSLDRTRLKEMLDHRIVDGTLMRLIGKCLHVGVLDGEEYSTPDQGTTQGSVLSPLLGNVYLHHVLDVWFDQQVKPRLRGQACLIRYADDFVIGFERQDDAERVYAALGKRMERFGLALHPDKTRLIPFGRPKGTGGKGPATFDFLGFTLYWRRTRKGAWSVWCKTRSARLGRAVQAAAEHCRRHRHDSIKEQHAALRRRIQGHFNYFGVNGNMKALYQLNQAVRRVWYKWLRRRSQRSSLTWERFNCYLERYPLPRPRVAVQI